jgi:hypothetical protein
VAVPRCAVDEPQDVPLVEGGVARCWLVDDTVEGNHEHATA